MKQVITISLFCIAAMLLNGCEEEQKTGAINKKTGCATNSPIVLSRSQIHVGMKIMDIWKLYGFRLDTGNSASKLVPQFAIQPLSEQENNECETSIYRYWLTQNGSKLPFLLTFQSCRLPNYDTVQKEKERIIDRFKEAAINDPNLKKELDTFCEENKLDSKNKELIIEMLVTNNDQSSLLPQCMTDWTLIEIKLDKNYKGAKKSGGSKTPSKKKSFSIQDLKLGMEKGEVEQICNGPLEFISSEAIPDSNGCSKTVYRMWPNETKGLLGQRIVAGSPAANLWARNKDIRPYQLIFVVSPPFTKELIAEYIKQKNITDPNEVATFESWEGRQYSQLIGVSQDMEMIKLQAIQQAQQTQRQQQNQINQNLNRIQNQLNWQEMQNFQRQSQEDFYRMQRNR